LWWTLGYFLPRVRGDCHTGAQTAGRPNVLLRYEIAIAKSKMYLESDYMYIKLNVKLANILVMKIQNIKADCAPVYDLTSVDNLCLRKFAQGRPSPLSL